MTITDDTKESPPINHRNEQINGMLFDHKQQQSALQSGRPSSAHHKGRIFPSVLHIRHDLRSQLVRRICSSDKKITFYTFEQNRKSGCDFGPAPHVRIYSGVDSNAHKTTVGVINLHGNAICLEINGQPRLTMSTCGSMTTRTYEYTSNALPGRRLKWKKDGVWSRGDWACEDQEGNVVARLKRRGFSMSKTGTFELGQLPLDHGEEAALEILAGGIALIVLQKKQDLESRGDVQGGTGY